MLCKIGPRHIVIDFSAFVGRDVGTWIATFVDKLFEKGVDIPND